VTFKHLKKPLKNHLSGLIVVYLQVLVRKRFSNLVLVRGLSVKFDP
jgi:hypothetical protein